jgi:YidC/Oxa1 family membrane protein insertase
MESGRFLLAIVLMIAVVIVTNIIYPPVRSPAPPPALPDTAAPAIDTTPAAARPPVAETPPTVVSVIAPAETVLVRTPLAEYGISTMGGALVSARLLQYQSFEEGSAGQVAQLVPRGTALVRLRVSAGNQLIDLQQLPFQAQPAGPIELAAGRQESVRLVHENGNGLRIELKYDFQADDYVVDVSGRVAGAGPSPQLRLDMGPRLGGNEADPREDQRAMAYVVNNLQTGIHSVPLARLEEQRIENGPLRWVALKSKYFLIAGMQTGTAAPFGGVLAAPGNVPMSAELSSTLLANEQGEFAFRLYVGPQEFDRLAGLNNQMQDVSVFGWRFLQPVLRPLGHAITWALLQMHRVLGLGYGWVLFLFGFIIRFLLWPLNAKAMRSQLKNMEMQPRIKEMQARFKNDPQKLQQEMLKLYKEEGFNPMGGCLPMLLPLPVLITLFFVFQGTIEFRGVPFLWLPDLARKDPLYILPVLLGLSMFVQQWLNMKSTKDAPPQMKWMTYFMPIFLTFLFLNFASGLNLYYAAMNLASVPQQLQIMRERERRTQGKKPS